ncbi:hypothetical protein Bca101_001491 [Brassica carinata]
MPSVNGEDEAMARPTRVKAAKAQAKRPVGEEAKKVQQFQQMWKIRERDLAFKDKLTNKKLLESLLTRTEPLTDLEVALKNKLISEMLSIGTSQTYPQMASRKPIVCGLSARGIMPPLQPEVTDEDVADNTPTEVEVVEISDEEEDDMVELSCEEYMRNMGYLIRVEESEGDIEPEFRRMLQRMREEEKKLRQGIKVEEGQSSKKKRRS